MGFHKHGVFSFTVNVQRMRLIAGDSYVADVIALRRHGPTGAAQRLDVPKIQEQYGETAQEAEGRAIKAIRDWLNGASPAMPVHANP
jgi:hypothetical protein